MVSRGVTRVADMVGEELPKFVRTADLDRSTIVYPMINRDTCIGCGRCYVSCRDGGHQAITFGEDRQPRIIGTKCVGCHLCYLICPTDSISLSKRIPKRKNLQR
jgi:dihydropyrimidine dehydrogenase (NAD+) subunit PreA